MFFSIEKLETHNPKSNSLKNTSKSLNPLQIWSPRLSSKAKKHKKLSSITKDRVPKTGKSYNYKKDYKKRVRRSNMKK